LDRAKPEDPDQQMLNLFDEQLENMRRIIEPDQQLGLVFSPNDHHNPKRQKPSTAQGQMEENVELTSKLPTGNNRITMPGFAEAAEELTTNNYNYTEETLSETSTPEANQPTDPEDITTKTQF